MSDCEEIDMDEIERRDLHPVKVEGARRARRWLGANTAKRRGCEYCIDMIVVGRDYLPFIGCSFPARANVQKGARYRFCSHEVCPYHELDGIKKDYIKEYDWKVARGLDTAMKCLRNMGVKEQRKARAAKAKGGAA